MQALNVLLALLSLFLIPSKNLFAQAGNLDNSFGNGGIVKQDITGNNDYGFTSAIQADGKILVAGFGHIDTLTYNDFVLLRYQVNGNLDSSFGINGMVKTDLSSGHDDQAMSICLQSDGKILVAGRSLISNAYDFAVARYHTNGTLDSTFDGDGKVITNLGGVNDYGSCVKIQSDGKIVLTGFSNAAGINRLATVRYLSNGSLDQSFDSDGMVFTQMGEVYIDGQSMSIQNDGKIVACATTKFPGNEYDVLLVRYNSDGSLDQGFDNDGIVTTDVCYHDDAYALAIQNDGKILVVGSSYDTVNITMGKNVMLIRFQPNGSMDSSFGIQGKVFTEVSNQADFANGVAIQSNGKIVVVGRSADGVSLFSIILVRYLIDGSLDNSFGSGGVVTTNLANGHEYGQSIGLQADGRIVVAGFYNQGGFNMFLARYLGDEPTGIYSSMSLNKIMMSPNPFSSSLNIHSEQWMHDVQLTLYNLQGQLIYRHVHVSGHDFTIPRNQIVAGRYILLFEEKNREVQQFNVMIQD